MADDIKTRQALQEEVAALRRELNAARAELARLKANGAASLHDEDDMDWADETIPLRTGDRASLLQVLLDAPMMVDLFDRNGRCWLWNRECEHQLGWSFEELSSMEDPLAALYPEPEQYTAVLANISRSDGVLRECRVRAKDGSMHIQLWANFVTFTGDHISLGHDITELKNAEASLREMYDQLRASRNTLEQLIQQTPVGIQVFNSSGLCTDANESHLGIFGVERDQVVETYNILTDNMAATTGTREGFKKALLGEMVDLGDIEFDFTQADSRYTRTTGSATVHVTFFPVFDEMGEISNIVAVNQDVTERKQSEQQRVELALERGRVQLLRDFISDVSHDIKTPLAVINTKLYLLRIAPDANRREEHITAIGDQVAHLNQLIDDMLLMSRLDSDVQLDYQSVNVHSVIIDIDEALRTIAMKKRVQMNLELTLEMPTIHADPKELYRALTNLVKNALQYTPSGGMVRVRSFTAGEEIVISVEDTGIGIGEKDLPHIFERFYRADQARSTHTGGSGLGLAIVKKIVESHNGRLEVESKVGTGSIFRICLPTACTPSPAI